MDAIVGSLMDSAGVTGLDVGIVRDGRVVCVKSYGYKNGPAGLRGDTATCMYGASLSKAVFAYLVMQLVGEGVIDLDKPLYTYLPKPIPEYPNYKDLAGDDRWRLITARHCLSHTTGFPNFRWFNPHGNNKLELFFTPGSRYAYSGEGLVLLQLVVETVTGRSLEELARQRIFEPYGMRRTGYVWRTVFGEDYAVGHTADGDSLPKKRRDKPNAAGSLETTIADYTRFLAAVMQRRGISAKAWEEMVTPQIAIYEKHQFPSLNTDSTLANRGIGLSYGLGWGLFRDAKAGKVFFKEGHDEGWQNYCICIPGRKEAFVFLSNSDNAEGVYAQLVRRLAGVDIPWEWEGYQPFRASVVLPEDALRQWVGEYRGQDTVRLFVDNGRLRVE
ncbi:MAG: beta-lactamase family protein, partial [Bacteroidetes bacterium]|nr:beta-lactamase family protein [Bacteroidota bacterium]